MKATVLFRSCLVLTALLLPVGNLQAQTNLTLSSAVVSPGGAAPLDLSLSSPASSPLEAVQWTFSYPAASVGSWSVTAGPALSSAGKTITCAAGTSSYACIAWGLNSDVISNGVIATLSVTPSGNSAVPIAIGNSVGASFTGDAIAVTGTGGIVSVAAGAGINSIACSPGTLAPSASSTCTVVLSGSGGGTVSLSSSSPNLTVPASLTIPSGSGSGSFLATTSAFSTEQTATVTATFAGSSQSVALPLVVDTPSLQCSPTSLTINSITNCTVTLSSAAPANSPISVAISSDNPALIVLAPTVVVAAGSTTAHFTEIAGVFTADQTATLTATLNGSSATSSISLVAPITLSSLECAPRILAANSSTTCTVIISKGAPAGGTAVSLSSTAASVLTVPASVTVPASFTSSTFTASAGALTADQTAAVTATLNGSSQQSTLSLLAAAALSALQCATASLTSNASTTCTVALAKAAPAGGIAVSLSSSLPSLLSVPGTVTVPASAASATFTASAATISTSQGAVVTAAEGGASFAAAISLVAPAATKPLSLSCAPAVLTPGVSGSCVMSLAVPAPSPTAIYLWPTYQLNQAFMIPATLTIATGATTGSVNFTTTSALTGSMMLVATVGPTSQDYAIFTFTVQAQSLPLTTNLVSLACTKRIPPGISGVCELRLSPSGTSRAAAISITSSSSRLKVPQTLQADRGQTTIRFEVVADPEATNESAFLEASAGENTVRESLAVVSSGPRLLAPGKVAVLPATAGRFRVSATGTATITAAGLPPGSAFDANTGAFEWTPTAADVGEHDISFIATDTQGIRTGRTVVVYVGTGAPVVTQLRNIAGGRVCSPGAMAAISGWFLSRADTPFADRSGRSGSLGETRVLVNGAYVPILSTSSHQVEFLCPALPARTPLDIAVETPSGQSNLLQTTMAETAPAIVTVDGSPQGQALAIRANSAELAALPNFRLPARPAFSGEPVYLWATGIECATSPRLWLNLGGQPVAIDSARPVDQMAGLCEIAFRIPANVIGDSVPIVIETRRSDATISSSNRTSVAVRSSSIESNANDLDREERQ